MINPESQDVLDDATAPAVGATSIDPAARQLDDFSDEVTRPADRRAGEDIDLTVAPEATSLRVPNSGANRPEPWRPVTRAKAPLEPDSKRLQWSILPIACGLGGLLCGFALVALYAL